MSGKKEPNCHVFCPGKGKGTRWSLEMYINRDYLEMCYPRGDGQSSAGGWIQGLHRQFRRTKRQLDKGMQTVQRRMMYDRILDELKSRWADKFESYDFDRVHFIFFDYETEADQPVRLTDRVLG